jgi:hypothetical protein
MLGILVAMAIGLAAPDGAAAQATCRSDALGAVVCDDRDPGRPAPRPPFTSPPPPGLGQMLDRPPAGAASPEIVPGWRENSFGRTLVRPGEAPSGGRCRTDTLGNMRCP